MTLKWTKLHQRDQYLLVTNHQRRH